MSETTARYEAPRRNDTLRRTPAEAAIAAAASQVEHLGADVRLTHAVVKLGEARALVADFIDGVPFGEGYPRVAGEPAARTEVDAAVQRIRERLAERDKKGRVTYGNLQHFDDGHPLVMVRAEDLDALLATRPSDACLWCYGLGEVRADDTRGKCACCGVEPPKPLLPFALGDLRAQLLDARDRATTRADRDAIELARDALSRIAAKLDEMAEACRGGDATDYERGVYAVCSQARAVLLLTSTKEPSHEHTAPPSAVSSCLLCGGAWPLSVEHEPSGVGVCGACATASRMVLDNNYGWYRHSFVRRLQARIAELELESVHALDRRGRTMIATDPAASTEGDADAERQIIAEVVQMLREQHRHVAARVVLAVANHAFAVAGEPAARTEAGINAATPRTIEQVRLRPEDGAWDRVAALYKQSVADGGLTMSHGARCAELVHCARTSLDGRWPPEACDLLAHVATMLVAWEGLNVLQAQMIDERDATIDARGQLLDRAQAIIEQRDARIAELERAR
jgi:hypothetical protein